MTKRRTPVYGVTKCPGCHKPLDNGADRPLAERKVEVNGWGVSPSGHAYRHIHPHTEIQKWHADCLDGFLYEFKVSQARLAVSTAEDNLEMTMAAAAASDPGSDLSKWVEKAEARVAEAKDALDAILKEHTEC